MKQTPVFTAPSYSSPDRGVCVRRGPDMLCLVATQSPCHAHVYSKIHYMHQTVLGFKAYE